MDNLRRFSAVSLLTATTLLVASCADTPTATPSSFSVEPAGAASASESATASPSPTRNENDRGDLIKEIGEPAGISADPEDENWVQFKATSIAEAVCTSEYAEPPAEGNHLLQIDLEVETTKAMREALEESGTSPAVLTFNTGWFAYASNGTTMNSVDSMAAYSCLDEGDRIPDMIGPAEKVVGSVVLEVSDSTGEVAWRPWYGGGSLGWTWAYDVTASE